MQSSLVSLHEEPQDQSSEGSLREKTTKTKYLGAFSIITLSTSTNGITTVDMCSTAKLSASGKMQ